MNFRNGIVRTRVIEHFQQSLLRTCGVGTTKTITEHLHYQECNHNDFK